MTAPDTTLLTTEHIELIGIIVMPIMSGIGYLIWKLSQVAFKVDTMWEWLSNHQGQHGLLDLLEEKRNGRQGKRG